MSENITMVNITSGVCVANREEFLRRISLAVYTELLKYAELKADNKQLSA